MWTRRKRERGEPGKREKERERGEAQLSACRFGAAGLCWDGKQRKFIVELVPLHE